MADKIDYQAEMQRALRGMIAGLLREVAEKGLPGKHHFYITFDTRLPGVDMSAALKARFPESMTVVLQDWFRDLAVSEDRFAVTLNFGNVPEPLVIPFAALRAFADPSAEFGLRLDPIAPKQLQANAGPEPKGPPEKPRAERPGQAAARPEGKAGAKASVVSLDAFRKP